MFAPINVKKRGFIAQSSNGRTPGFGPGNLGSNPSRAATMLLSSSDRASVCEAEGNRFNSYRGNWELKIAETLLSSGYDSMIDNMTTLLISTPIYLRVEDLRGGYNTRRGTSGHLNILS